MIVKQDCWARLTIEDYAKHDCERAASHSTSLERAGVRTPKEPLSNRQLWLLLLDLNNDADAWYVPGNKQLIV